MNINVPHAPSARKQSNENLLNTERTLVENSINTAIKKGLKSVIIKSTLEPEIIKELELMGYTCKLFAAGTIVSWRN